MHLSISLHHVTNVGCSSLIYMWDIKPLWAITCEKSCIVSLSARWQWTLETEGGRRRWRQSVLHKPSWYFVPENRVRQRETTLLQSDCDSQWLRPACVFTVHQHGACYRDGRWCQRQRAVVCVSQNSQYTRGCSTSFCCNDRTCWGWGHWIQWRDVVLFEQHVWWSV